MLNIQEYEPQNIIPIQINTPNNKTTRAPFFDSYRLIAIREQNKIRSAHKIQILQKLLVKFNSKRLGEFVEVQLPVIAMNIKMIDNIEHEII